MVCVGDGGGGGGGGGEAAAACVERPDKKSIEEE